MISLIQHPITEALGWTMIHSLWQLTLLAILHRGLLALPALQKAQIRYIAGMALLGLALLLPALTFFQVYEPPLVQELAQHTADLAIPLEATDEASVELLLKTPPPSETGQAATSFHERLQHLLLGLEPLISPLALGWILGILFMGIRFGGSWFYLRSLRREGLEAVEPKWESTFQQWVAKMGIRRPVRVYYSQKVFEPITLGHLKPLVLIPLGLLSQQDPQQIEALILHELAHIRRHDFTFNIVQSWVEILFFYHPAIWWISRDVRESREHCCDDTAIAVSQNPLAYAQALTQLQLTHIKHPQKQLTMSASGNTSKFTQRIYRIMGQPTRRLEYSRGNVVAILAFLATFLFAFQQQQFQEEQQMLEDLMENPQIETSTFQNWLLFTIHPQTSQNQIDSWLQEVAQLSSHPFELQLEREAKAIKTIRAYKTIDQEEQNLWELSHENPENLKKLMLVYDPILNRLYIQSNHTNHLFFYNLETDAFGSLEGELLPFGRTNQNSLVPTISFEEQNIEELPQDKFTIEFTPNTTMDELLGWNLACSKLGMKLEYDQITYDSETGKLVKISGIYQNSVGKTLPFSYENFSFVEFVVNRNEQRIPTALAVFIDSTETSQEPNTWQVLKPKEVFSIHPGSSTNELNRIQNALSTYDIKLKWDHIRRNISQEITEVFGRFLYPNKTFRLFKIEELNELDIQVLPRQEDPIKLVLGKGTLGSQTFSPKALFTPVVEGTTHRFGRYLNIKKGPGTFEENGLYNMWYGSSDAIFQREYEKFEQALSSSTLLYLNNKQINAEEFRQLALPVDSVKEFFYRDPIAAKQELGKDFFGPVYHVNTFKPTPNKVSKPNYIHPETSTDTPAAPLLVLDGEIQSRTGQTENLGLKQIQEISGLDPDDIKSINVLKGEAALKKYGEQGKNGVIEIISKDKRELPEVEKIDALDPISLTEMLNRELKNGIRIKGSASTDSTQPLYVLNGKALINSSTGKKEAMDKDLAPEDIDRINVLKGEAAIEKYGAKGENGVVEIFTKDAAGKSDGNQEIEPQEPLPLPEIEREEPKNEVRIKGSASADSNQPLFVIDGIEFDHYSIGDDGFLDIDLNPADIEHINVLKGEAAKVKYGPKGEKGVIEIETKLKGNIRLKISDRTVPNGTGDAKPNMSDKLDDVLILKQKNWLEKPLSINGNGVPMNPSEKYRAYNNLKSHKILAVRNSSYAGVNRRFIYTDQAPAVMWNSAIGQDPYKFPDTYLFLMNNPSKQKSQVNLRKNPNENYGIQTDDERIPFALEVKVGKRGVAAWVKERENGYRYTMRLLSPKEAIKEFGTTGATGLMVIEFKDGEEKEEETLSNVEENTQLPSTTDFSDLPPYFSETPKNFPIVALGVSPNPADQKLDIVFLLEKKKELRLSVYDRSGREVAIVEEGVMEKGKYKIEWDRKELAAGMYFVVAQIAGQAMSTPFILE